MCVTAIYPVPFADACDAAVHGGLPSAGTFIEPSCYVGYAFETAKDAVHFVLRFDGARRWPVPDPDVHLLIARPDADAEEWLDQEGIPVEIVEITAMQFATADDQRTFEAALIR